jgi:hypothetical protein
LLRLATAVLMEIDDEWQTEKRYLPKAPRNPTQNQDRIYRKTVALSCGQKRAACGRLMTC